MSSLVTKIDLNTLEKNLEINFTKEISKIKTELSNKISETHIILTKEISKSQITIILSIFLLVIGAIIANKFLP